MLADCLDVGVKTLIVEPELLVAWLAIERWQDQLRGRQGVLFVDSAMVSAILCRVPA